MRYLLQIYSPENSWTPEEREQCMETSSSIARELAAEGKLICSSPLHPVATGSTLRLRNGEQLVTAGPFAETTEQLGGFYLLDVATQEEAVAVAKRLPPAKKGTVEVRPVREVKDLPPEKVTPGDIGDSGTPPGLKRYMIFCYHEEAFWANAGEEAYSEALGEAIALCRRFASEGKYLSASPLLPSTTAKSVRVRNDRPTVTDGPFAETREVLGGYYMILAKDQAEALAVAAQTPGARDGSCEVRQVFDLPR
jgi:hypothetical protein